MGARVVQQQHAVSAKGHQIHRFRGPVRWATVYVAPQRIIVRRGTIIDGDIPPEASIYPVDHIKTALGSALRYARRRR